jgi:hypothetical protein
LAEGFEAEGFGWLAMENADEVERSLTALALGELACRRRRFFVEGVDDERAIADGPRIRLAFDAHFGDGANASALFGNIEVLNQGPDGSPDGANDGGAREHSATLQFYSFVGGGYGTGVQENSDAGFFHFLLGERAELGSYFRKDLVLGMDEGDNHILFAKIVVEASAAANQFVDFSGDFDAAEAGANDDKVEIPAAALGIARSFGLFHLTDDVLAEVNGIAHDFECERVFGHAGDDAEVAFRPARKHYVVVVQARQDAVSIVKFNFRSMQVYSLHALGAAADAGEHLAKRSCGRVGVDGCSGDIRKQRMKDHVILAIEEENLRVGSAELAAKSFCELYGGKSPADDDDSNWLHFFAPMAGRSGYAAALARQAWPLEQSLKKDFAVLLQDKGRGILRISETCELYSKWTTELRLAWGTGDDARGVQSCE